VFQGGNDYSVKVIVSGSGRASPDPLPEKASTGSGDLDSANGRRVVLACERPPPYAGCNLQYPTR